VSVDALLRPDPVTDTTELLEQAVWINDEDDDGSARRLVHHRGT
jgi:hypothetical protein